MYYLKNDQKLKDLEVLSIFKSVNSAILKKNMEEMEHNHHHCKSSSKSEMTQVAS
jgi:hypothetical protein